jgi:hypothetical protein
MERKLFGYCLMALAAVLFGAARVAEGFRL